MDNIQSYIATERAKGISDAQIRANLLAAGWQEVQINSAIGAGNMPPGVPIGEVSASPLVTDIPAGYIAPQQTFDNSNGSSRVKKILLIAAPVIGVIISASVYLWVIVPARATSYRDQVRENQKVVIEKVDDLSSDVNKATLIQGKKDFETAIAGRPNLAGLPLATLNYKYKQAHEAEQLVAEYDQRVLLLFERGISTAGYKDEIQKSFVGLADAVIGGSSSSASALRSAGQKIKQVADKLSTVSPPEEYKSFHDEVVSGYKKFAQLYVSLASYYEKADYSGYLKAYQDLQTVRLDINKAIEKVRTEDPITKEVEETKQLEDQIKKLLGEI